MEEANKLATPVLIVRAEKDTAVDPEAQEEFCDQTRKCELENITKTGHELLVETEEIRKKFFEHFDAFVNR